MSSKGGIVSKPRLFISMCKGVIEDVICDVDLDVIEFKLDDVGVEAVDRVLRGTKSEMSGEFCRRCKQGGRDEQGWTCIDDIDVRKCEQFDRMEE